MGDDEKKKDSSCSSGSSGSSGSSRSSGSSISFIFRSDDDVFRYLLHRLLTRSFHFRQCDDEGPIGRDRDVGVAIKKTKKKMTN